MSALQFKYVYGPVSSRRLGRSLGIDPVPFKTCPYNCIFCQLGCTTNLTMERREYHPADEILDELKQKLAVEEDIDYISIAGSGEPTLNSRIGDLVSGIKKSTSTPLAVLTNGSLLWMEDVRDSLLKADLVIPSLCAGDEHMFRVINRPREEFSFESMASGIVEFSRLFRGEIWLEVVLLAGLNDTVPEIERIVQWVERIKPARIQLNTAVRPPAEKKVRPLSMEQMKAVRNLFPGHADIICREKTVPEPETKLTEADEETILTLLRRRPCTVEDIARGLGIHINEAVKHLGELVNSQKIDITVTGGRNYYIVIRHISH